MAYDSAIGRTILFGGTSSVGNVNETWSFDGSTWNQVAQGSSIPALSNASMAYDIATNTIILFGGDNQGVFSPLSNETWSFNGSTWSLLFSSPSARYGASIAYDTSVDKVILFGGTMSFFFSYNDTWSFNGSIWQNITPPGSSPSIRYDASMAYDVASDTVILFGGTNGSPLNDTWSFNVSTSTWTPLSPNPSPSVRSAASMAYDIASSTIILFGGTNGSPLNDTWSFNASTSTWTPLSPIFPPSVRSAASMSYDTSSDTIILFGGTNGSPLNDTWSFNASTSTWTPLSPIFPPSVRSAASMSYDTSSGTIILFGGTNGSPLNDTWNFNASTSTWTPLSPTFSPSARYDASMTYDSVINKMILFGGWNGTNSFDDTWNLLSSPLLDSLSPPTGSTNGGTSVVISGFYFTADTTVTFDNLSASVHFDSTTQITATSPAHAAGTINVIATNSYGPSNAMPFTYVPPPIIQGLSPNTGSTNGGTNVTISGSNFTGATSVLFGSTSATSFHVDSDIQITTTSPSHAAGTVDVTITTPYGTSATGPNDRFTYVPPPSIQSLSPNTGSTNGGTSVIISGSNFTGATSVLFGSTSATSFHVDSDIQITTTSPSHAAGTVDVTITTPYGTSATGSNDRFTYVPPPSIQGLSPNTGPITGGTNVTISGSNFTGATSVLFGSTPATSFHVDSDIQITTTSPSHAAGTVDVTITTPYGTSATGSNDRFTYVTPPSIQGLSPNTGPITGGTNVTISGSNFTGATSVLFGSIPATSFHVDSDIQITATSPSHAAGTVDVTITTPYGTSATGSNDRFTYVPPPSIQGLSPNTGPITGGTNVTISGSNFTGATSVLFGSIPATSFHVDSDIQITATSPSHAAGTVDVTITTPYGTSATGSNDQFTYILAPHIQSLLPNAGPIVGGTDVIISGFNFTSNTTVAFDNLPVFVHFDSTTQITATSPPHAAGTVNVTATDLYGTSNAMPFIYVPPPNIQSLSPNMGSTLGGTNVIIYGSNFSEATSVFFGLIPATSFHVDSDTQITAISPAHTAGTVDVTITTAYGTSDINPNDKYTFVPTLTANVSLNSSLNPSDLGQLVTFIATVTSSTEGYPTGTVTFSVDDTQSVSVSLNNGSATYSISSLSVGSHSVIAKYSGDNTFVSSTSNKVTQIVVSTNSPEHVRGKQVKNRFVTQTDRINVITWKAPSSGTVPVTYKIYADASLSKLVATVKAKRGSQHQFKYTQHDCSKDKIYTYYIVSIDALGNISAPAEIVIHGHK